MENIFAKAKEAASFIESIIENIPSIGLSLGTGSSIMLDSFEVLKSISYSSIPHFPTSSVTSHVNELIFAKAKGKKVLILGGRMHYYEGWSMKELTFPIRVLQALGIQQLICTNASGGLNENYISGEIVLVRDHINLLPAHPLRGDNEEQLGLRFPDMSDAYSERLRNIVMQKYPSLKQGVYVGYQGPSLETPAEYEMMHRLGADLIGMSTVPEVIVANHAGIEVLVFSIATNICYPPEKITPTTLEEVIGVAHKSASTLTTILETIIEEI